MIKTAGQVTLLVLLLGLLGLTVSLAAISGSLKNLRQTTNTDFGTKALAGAESVLEYGITKYDPTRNYFISPDSGTIDLSTTFPGLAGNPPGEYTITAVKSDYAEFVGVGVDDVVTLDGTKISNPTNLFVVWKGNDTAILITALYKKAGAPILFVLDRFAFNSASFSLTGNNFSSSVAATTPGCTSTATPLCADSNYNNVNTSCTINNLIPINHPTAGGYFLHSLRIRPLYASTDIAVCAAGSGGSEDLGAQTILVTGKATTSDGTTRRVQATQTSTGLPGLFDYAIYTEGALSK